VNPLLDAALASAVKEMDLRTARAELPAAIALLRERVASAIANVAFYSDLYRPHGPPPEEAGAFVSWFQALPVVSRTDFEDVPETDRINRAYADAPLVRKQTSGSTGIPFVLYIDERVASFRSWRFRRPHFEAGETSPLSLEFLFPERFRRDKQVKVVGGKAVKGNGGRAGGASVRKVAMRTEKSYSTLTDALKSPEAIYGTLAAKAPATLIGYASSIVALAAWMGGEHRLPSVKRIWTTSEMLTPDGREAIRQAFGFEAREAYASVEFGFMGWQETPLGQFRLETDRLVFECVDLASNRPARPGDTGRVVISDLLNDATPLIRYDIGDLAVMGEPLGEAEGWYGSIEELRGKSNDSIRDAVGRRIEPFALLGCLKENLGAAQYRLICLEPGLFVLQYRPARSAAIRVDAAIEGLRRIVGEPNRIVAQRVPAIRRETSGKLRPIIDLSTIEGSGRERLLSDLHLADLPSVLAS
jgi:phenylacetate-coenzyme A ligase PaaK-like adenylate-forming protein